MFYLFMSEQLIPWSSVQIGWDFKDIFKLIFFNKNVHLYLKHTLHVVVP